MLESEPLYDCCSILEFHFQYDPVFNVSPNNLRVELSGHTEPFQWVDARAFGRVCFPHNL
jgi:hypothetical protein